MAKIFLRTLRIQGVKLGSTLDGELRHMGITPRTLPCVIRKYGHLGDVDNFVASEYSEYPVEDSGDGYIDRDYVLDRIRDEYNGHDTLSYEEIEQQNYEQLELQQKQQEQQEEQDGI